MSNQSLANLIQALETLAGSHRNDLIIEKAHEVLKIDPHNFQAFFYLGWAYNNSRQYDKMYETLQNALAEHAREPCLYHQLAYYYMAQGGKDYIKAKEAEEKAIQLDPKNSSYYRILGEIYLINREADKAAKALQKAVDLDPDYAEYRSRLALALLRLHKKHESLEMAEKALSQEPDNERVLDSVGMIYILSGELETAEKFFREALKRFPTYDYYQKHLAWVLREKEDQKNRHAQGKKYTPLYLRHKGTKLHFNEDK